MNPIVAALIAAGEEAGQLIIQFFQSNPNFVQEVDDWIHGKANKAEKVATERAAADAVVDALESQEVK
jgi:hypothetical protein